MGLRILFLFQRRRKAKHVHVRKAGGFAKFWIEPVELEFLQGLKVAEIRKAEELILENLELIKNKWNEVFGS